MVLYAVWFYQKGEMLLRNHSADYKLNPYIHNTWIVFRNTRE